MSRFSDPIGQPIVATATAPLRVALLEDDDVLRDRVLLPGLQRHGFEVTPLRTAQALWAALDDHRFDLIVLDIGLPDSDGFTLTEQLQAQRPGLGIIILSGRGEQPDLVRGLTQGADSYLIKPVQIEILAATLFSVARRMSRPLSSAPNAAEEWQLQDDGWCLFSPEGQAVALTGSERKVVQSLWSARGRLVTRDALIGMLGGNLGLEVDPHRLDALLHRLRLKVQERTGVALPLKAVRGEGYLFMPQER
ncbi:response regulator transcription factor [Xanthomonas sp. SI]|uniref:response regulator transcription factor n=1 Tax=Xanthomonas sp. SI TaxID=2724123 RepID=UPI00163AE188|nr:response regulator transcription factor [Xanthomonas sp. SI]QNH14621.1 DNA-binding response regulator [Xanthomonas sp. SI]